MDLICCETDTLRRAYEDPNLIDDDRVLQNLLSTEERYQPSANYFTCVQDDLKPHMRVMVAQWMLEVCGELSCEEEVFPLSMNYLDRFLCVHTIKRNQLQLLGSACMFLSSKMMQTIPLAAEKLVMYTDHSITLESLLAMELHLLCVLKWDLMAITPNDFIELILRRLPIDSLRINIIKKHAHTFIAMCYTDCKFMTYTPSTIAVGCIGAAMQGLTNTPMVNFNLLQRLHEITHIELDYLRACQDQIEQKVAYNLSNLNIQEVDIASKNHTVKEHPTTPTGVNDINF
ncbi:G1/S-specific cyclin-D2 isoform X2 [Octopus sinensis]|uniref:G1/S-specific cyclin-D2 isoform X1 n=1 Tax=Octopus sinensis TaxID=2607531 RepID=A0A6P7SNL3_9MOLL|nr:G1/S-specific cyclin-D2 isoform X1 [Octopus sinensis]XP_036361244.1 G1/S-specific cyclin-D2 isoform X2 [Octopus sinensis]